MVWSRISEFWQPRLLEEFQLRNYGMTVKKSSRDFSCWGADTSKKDSSRSPALAGAWMSSAACWSYSCWTAATGRARLATPLPFFSCWFVMESRWLDRKSPLELSLTFLLTFRLPKAQPIKHKRFCLKTKFVFNWICAYKGPHVDTFGWEERNFSIECRTAPMLEFFCLYTQIDRNKRIDLNLADYIPYYPLLE